MDFGDDFDLDEDFFDFYDEPSNQTDGSSKTNCQGESLEDISDKVWCFSCQGSNSNLREIGNQSYLGNAFFSSQLGSDSFKFNLDESYDLFNLPLNLENIVCNIEHYFSSVMLNISILEQDVESYSNSGANIGQNTTYMLLRKDCIQFLQSIYAIITKSTNAEDNEFINQSFLEQLIVQMLDLLLYLQWISNLPAYVSSANSSIGNNCKSAPYHLAHLHLDIRWWCLMIFHKIEVIHGISHLSAAHPLASFNLCNQLAGTNFVSTNLFEQLVDSIVLDVIVLMNKQANKLNVNDLDNTSFTCSCILELIISLTRLMQYRHENYSKLSFWEYTKEKNFFPIIVPTLNQETNLENSPMNCLKEIKSHHNVWIYSHFVHSFSYDENGIKLNDKSNCICSDPKLLRKFVKESIIDAKLPELEIRYLMRTFSRIFKLWNNDIQIVDSVAVMWEYFFKNIDDQFNIPGVQLKQMVSTKKSIASWICEVKVRSSQDATKADSSWEIFLHVVAFIAKRSPNDCRLLKGRIFSRYHGRKMADLNPNGLVNTIDLFLTLAYNSEPIDICKKLIELLTLVPAPVTSKLKIVIKGLLATCLLLVQLDQSIEPILQPIENVVSKVYNDFSSIQDPCRKREYGQLISIYNEGLIDIIEGSNSLAYGQENLFIYRSSNYLQGCSVSDLNIFLTSINSALSKSLELQQNPSYLSVTSKNQMVPKILKEYGPFIKSHSTTLTPPLKLAFLAGNLTLGLALDSSVTSIKEALSFFTLFTSSDSTNPELSVQYLRTILAHSQSTQILTKICADYQEKIISSLLVHLILIGDTSDIISLCDIIFKLPKITKYSFYPPACPFAAFQTLFQEVFKKFSETQVLSTRSMYRDECLKYLEGTDKAMSSLLKKTPEPPHLSRIICFISDIISDLSQLIYQKSNPRNLLHSLLTSLVLPKQIYDVEYKLNATYTIAFTEALPKIIYGLSSLGMKQNPYIQCRLSEIFKNYMIRFPIRNKSGDLHPFVISLCLSDLKEENLIELRKIFLQVVNENYIMKRNVSQQQKLVFQLLIDLFNYNSYEWISIMCDKVLFSVLELLLGTDDLQLKEIGTNYLERLLNEASLATEIIQNIFRTFILKHMSWSSNQLFRILEAISILSRQTILNAIPDIKFAIRKTEEKRGTGMNLSLRTGYKKLMSTLAVDDHEF